MTPDPLDRIRAVKDIPALIAYLRDELDWPIGAEDFDELTFEYQPEELGIDARTAARIEEIKQLRPLAASQPWGVFFIRFEPKRLPVVVLRRILSQLVVKKRASAEKSHRATWNLHDLLFISNYGEDDQRQITFAHFTQDVASGDLPTLKVLGWDDADTALHISHVHHELKEKLHWPEDEKDLDGWREKWSSAFTLRHRQVITTSKDLAVRLADLARRIRRRAGQVLAVETERGPLRKLHKAFREALIHDLSEDDFADMYAQTIAYGLLAARVSRPMGIIAENVTDMVPMTNPFLREMLGTFLTIGGRKGKMDFDELGIQDVVDLLNNRDTHMEAILRDFGNRTRQEDPVIHFYELFLAEYDKKMKVKRGVFYTPQPVVSYIVRSVHELLQTEFGLPDGLADTTTWGEMAARFAKHEPSLPFLRETSLKSSLPSREISPKSSLPSREGSREGESVPFNIPDGVSPDTPFVQILDPATGTATFLVEVIDIIYKTMTAKWIREKRLEPEFDRLWNEYVPKHLLPRLYGYELMMAPYAIAHMKIGLKLFETGYRFGSNERAHIYLTNALEPPSPLAEQAAANLFEALGHEAQAVNAIKSNKRFTVVIGNPPYSYDSGNTGDYIDQLIEPYYSVSGQPLGERNPRGLQDDFVKFIRFGELLMNQTGVGVFGYITNNSYLDNPTYRGMRHSLQTSYCSIWILDLHGNSNLPRHSPEQLADQNVFEIQQGVGIILAKKCKGSSKNNNVSYGNFLGSRATKYNWLLINSAITTDWNAVKPQNPYWLFTPVNLDIGSEYNEHRKLTDVFPKNSVGLYTARDDFAVTWSQSEIENRIKQFIATSVENARTNFDLGKDTTEWHVGLAQEDIRAHGIRECFKEISYRPFDSRFTYYSGQSRGLICRPRPELMQHMLKKENIALCFMRRSRQDSINNFFVVRQLVDKSILSSADNANIAPLWLFPEQGGQLFSSACRPNFFPHFLEQLTVLLGLPQDGNFGLPQGLTPEDIFHYIYAVFYSPTYRTRYAEFLKIDFPRLPLTSSLELFRGLSRLGGELVALHLVEAPVQTGISIRHDKTGGWTYAYATPPPVRVAFTGPVGPVVDKVGWSDDTVWIDAVKPKKGAADAKVTGTVGFRGVPEEVWNFHIGGYQVCQKWLKDRKGRMLGAADLVHYHRIVVALHETIRLMAEIDRAIDARGGWPGAFIGEK